MAGDKKLLEKLLNINKFYGGDLTVENAINILGWEEWLEGGGWG